MKGLPGRTIRYSSRFDRECAEIDEDLQRMDEALMYVELVLASNPEFGLATAVPEIRVAPLVFPLGTSSGVLGASIFYTHDDDHVDFLSIRADL